MTNLFSFPIILFGPKKKTTKIIQLQTKKVIHMVYENSNPLITFFPVLNPFDISIAPIKSYRESSYDKFYLNKELENFIFEI